MRLAPLVVVLVAAGCVVPGPGPGPAPSSDWSVRALAFGEGHDHLDPAQHAATTPNFEVLGYDPLFSPDYGGTTPAGYACGDAQATTDGRRLAVIESRSDVGFTVADVTDPARPKWLGELVMRRTHIYDVAVVPDGKHVVAVTSGFDEPQQGRVAAAAIEWRSPCGVVPLFLPLPLHRPSAVEDPIARPPSTLLISIADPSRPTIIDQQPVEGLGHSLTSTLVDNTRFVAVASVLTSATDTFDFYEIVDTPLGARLSRLTTYTPLVADAPGKDIGGHSEALVTKHPATGKTVAYVQSRAAVRILDMTDPRMPAEMGAWSDETPERAGFSGSLHSVFPLPEMRGGRHYIVVGPEWGGHPKDHPSGIVWIVDDTDPAKMVAVAAWTLPHEVEWDGGEYTFSTHYLGVSGDTLFVSMYHGGVWAVDLADAGLGQGPGQGLGQGLTLLRSVGVFLPTNVSPKPPEKPFRWTPTVEEVLPMPDGTLVTFDSNSGLYTFRYDETMPMLAPEPWPVAALKG